MKKFIEREGSYFVRASDVVPGMMLDFDGDPIADPNGDGIGESGHVYGFEFEFAQAICVERETPECIVIHTTLGSFGFPPEHEIETTLDQLPVVIADSTKEGDGSILAYYESVKDAEADIALGVIYGEDSQPFDPVKVAQGLYHIDGDEAG